MCFSANVSFIAGAAVSVIGIMTLKKVQAPTQIVFASIPLIFGIQQISEGILWLTIPNPTYTGLQQFATYTFLFFARVVWPIWVPLSIFLLEYQRKSRKIDKVLLLLGTTVSFYFLVSLVLEPSEAIIIEHHIFYKHDYPTSTKFYTNVLYGIVTVLPLFISRFKGMWWLGTVIGISYIAAVYFFKQYSFSVWCFFAAIISMSVYYIINEITGSSKKTLPTKAFIPYDGAYTP